MIKPTRVYKSNMFKRVGLITVCFKILKFLQSGFHYELKVKIS